MGWGGVGVEEEGWGFTCNKTAQSLFLFVLCERYNKRIKFVIKTQTKTPNDEHEFL